MTDDIELYAIASNTADALLRHRVTVITNDMYKVTGAITNQAVPTGTTMTIECKCKGNATFVEWNNGSTSNPMTLTVNNNITIFPIV